MSDQLKRHKGSSMDSDDKFEFFKEVAKHLTRGITIISYNSDLEKWIDEFDNYISRFIIEPSTKIIIANSHTTQYPKPRNTIHIQREKIEHIKRYLRICYQRTNN